MNMRKEYNLLRKISQYKTGLLVHLCLVQAEVNDVTRLTILVRLKSVPPRVLFISAAYEALSHSLSHLPE